MKFADEGIQNEQSGQIHRRTNALSLLHCYTDKWSNETALHTTDET